MAVARSENLFRAHRFDDAIAVAEDAEAQVTHPGWQAELTGHRATLVLLHGDGNAAVSIVEPMLSNPEPRIFVQAALVAGIALPYDLRPLDGLALAARAHPMHLALWEDEFFQSEPGVHVLNSALGLIQSGQLAEAETLTALAFEHVVSEGMPEAIAMFALLRALLALEQGRLATAYLWFTRAAEYFDRYGPKARRRYALYGVLLVAAQLGLLGDARAAAADLAEPSTQRFNGAVELTGLAWLAWAEGRPADVAPRLLDALGMAVDAGNRTNAVGALFDLARLGHADASAVVESARDFLSVAQGELLQGRLQFVIASAADDADELVIAAETLARVGADLAAAEAFAAAAAAHRRRGDQRSGERLVHRATEHEGRCEGARAVGLTGASTVRPLTRREREVAVLAAAGLESKEIARRLDLSRRTVDNHLAHAYEKLGIGSREELTDALGAEPR